MTSRQKKRNMKRWGSHVGPIGGPTGRLDPAGQPIWPCFLEGRTKASIKGFESHVDGKAFYQHAVLSVDELHRGVSRWSYIKVQIHR